MKIVAISGSPRANGNTSYLTDEALREASKLGIETEKIAISQCQINLCQGHDECPTLNSCPLQDDAELVLRTLYDADGIILASPVYYYNVSAQLKALIDRSRFYLRHKKKMRARCFGIIVVATSAGTNEAADALLNYIRLSSNAHTNNVIQVHGHARYEGEIKSNTVVIEEARKLGRKMSEDLQEKNA